MENLSQQERAINLGKLLVKQLGLENSVDTLARWMAHYIAELMTAASKATGKNKAAAEVKCFETILKLWAHRRMLPNRKRPLENFEPIFELLDSIHPDKEQPYYVQIEGQNDLPDKNGDVNAAASVKDWLTIAYEIDKVARTWLNYALTKAAEGANSKATAKWLKNAIVLPDDTDIRVITVLLESDIPLRTSNAANAAHIKKDKKEKIAKRIEQLQNFAKLNDVILKAYQEELLKITE